MRRRFLAAAFAFGTVFAGCLEGDAGGGPPLASPAGVINSLAGFVDPFLMNHDHSDASLHALAFHARQLAHDPLGGNALKSSGAHALDLRGQWLFVGAYGLAADVDGGLYVFDVADPESPKRVGHFPMVGNVGGDRSVEATADGDWVVVGTEAVDCANHVNPFLPGLYLIDARDKANPRQADYVPDPGVHSVIVHRVAGRDYVVTLGADTVGKKNIREIDAAAGKFREVGNVPFSHDGAAVDDALLGIPLLYLTGETTLDVYDFSTPSAPKKLAAWTPPEVRQHYVHAVAMDVVEGRRLVVVESEDWQDRPSPFWVLDMTDLAAPDLLATWTNPAAAPADANRDDGPSLAFSTHNPRLEAGVLYLAHYHAGVWMFDLRTLEKARAPETMGYFLPHEDNGGYRPQSSQSALPLPPNPRCFGGFRLDEVPNTMDVEVRDGVVYAADLHTGLYAVRWDPAVVPAAP